MFRISIVITILIIGTWYSLRSPFHTLLFYIWNAYFRPEIWLWDDFLKSWHLSFAIGLYVVFSTIVSGKTFVFNSPICLIILFLIHTFLSTLYSLHYEYSFPYWIDFLKIIVIGYLMLILIDDFVKFRKLLLVLVLSLSFEATKQGWIHLITYPGWPNLNPLPFLGDNNGVALGMMMLVPIIILLAQTTPRRWTLPFYWFLLIGVVYRALSTHSRGGFLTCIVLGAMYCLQANRRLRAFFAVACLMLLILPVLPNSFWDRMRTIETYQEAEDVSALGRLHFWQVALLMAENHPFWGVGFNAYNPSYDDYDFSKGQYGYQRSVHSSFFGVLSELGYPGLILYTLIIIMAFHSCSRAAKISPLSPVAWQIQKSAFALRMSLLAFLIGGVFLPFQYQEIVWHYIFLSFLLEQLASKTYFIEKIA